MMHRTWMPLLAVATLLAGSGRAAAQQADAGGDDAAAQVARQERLTQACKWLLDGRVVDARDEIVVALGDSAGHGADRRPAPELADRAREALVAWTTHSPNANERNARQAGLALAWTFFGAPHALLDLYRRALQPAMAGSAFAAMVDEAIANGPVPALRIVIADPEFAEQAPGLLAQCRNPAMLAEAAVDTLSDPIRRAALIALRDLGPRAAFVQYRLVKDLFWLSGANLPPATLALAVDALVSIGTRRGISELLEKLARNLDTGVSARATAGLVLLDGQRGFGSGRVTLLARVARDANQPDDLRLVAAKALGYLQWSAGLSEREPDDAGFRDPAASALAAVADDARPALATPAARALAQHLEDPDVARRLATWLNGKDFWRREMAEQFFTSRAWPFLLPRLIGQLDSPEEADVAQALRILPAYGRRAADAIPRLLEIGSREAFDVLAAIGRDAIGRHAEAHDLLALNSPHRLVVQRLLATDPRFRPVSLDGEHGALLDPTAPLDRRTQALQHLASSAREPDPWSSSAVYRMLDDPRFVHAAVACLNSDHGPRMGLLAMNAGQLRPDSDTPLLRVAICSTDEALRRAAYRAMVIGEQEVGVLLADALLPAGDECHLDVAHAAYYRGDMVPDRAAHLPCAIDVLGTLPEHHLPPLDHLLALAENAAVPIGGVARLLGLSGRSWRAADVLDATLERYANEPYAADILRALSRTGSRRPAAIVELATSARAADIQIAAIDTIGHLGIDTDPALALLAQLVEAGTTAAPALRLAALRAAERIGAPGLKAIAGPLVKSGVRDAATLEWLRATSPLELPVDRIVPTLLELAEQAEDEDRRAPRWWNDDNKMALRVPAIRVLGAWRVPDAIPVLLRILPVPGNPGHGASDRTCVAAIHALGQFGRRASAAADTLRRMARNGPYPDAAGEALRQIEGDD